MLTQNQLNSIAALHPALTNTDNNGNTDAKLSDLSSHMTLTQVSADPASNGTPQQQSQQTNANHVNNNVINTISSTTSSVPITSIVSTNQPNDSNSSNDPGQQQQNSISVWSSLRS